MFHYPKETLVAALAPIKYNEGYFDTAVRLAGFSGSYSQECVSRIVALPFPLKTEVRVRMIFI